VRTGASRQEKRLRKFLRNPFFNAMGIAGISPASG